MGALSGARHDLLLAAGACLLDLVLFSHLLGDPDQPLSAPSALARSVVVGYALAGYTALLWRRRAPGTVFAVLLVHSLAAVPLPGYRPTVGLLVALYTVAAHRRGWVVPAALVGGLTASAGAVVNEVIKAAEALRAETALAVGSFFTVVNLGVWAAGRWVFASRRHAEDLEYRRQAEARAAVNAERTRIARELHDIVAHSVTVMMLQSAGAKGILTGDPERAKRALDTIEEQGRQAMVELRRLLAVLRPVDGDDGPAESGEFGGPDRPGGTGIGAGITGGSAGEAGAPNAPAALGPAGPRLSNLDTLVANARGAGLVVQVETDGQPRQLEQGVDLIAYRTVQEALTNATRHAGPGSTVKVRLAWLPDQLTIEVTDDGRGRPRPSVKGLSTGHGLLGLRERIALVNGELRVGPVGEGFRISATLPAGRPGSDRATTVPAAGQVRAPVATGTAGAPA